MKTTDHIFQISASQGGVPKLAVREAEVTPLGLSNDKHNNLKGHGGPERALCLYALERIVALQEEGHPIFPGSVGENVTISGLDWEKITPGVRLRLGEAVVVEVTRYTTPCNNVAGSFAYGDSSRIAQEKHPGWSRVYTRVLRTGTIRAGDAVQPAS